jgi:hypothetical protein
MRKRTIVTLVLAIICSLLGFRIFNSIVSKDKEVKDIAIFETQTIDKLIDIRKAEKAYFNVKGEYTPNWDTLKAFINDGHFLNTERIEVNIPREFGGDSTYVTYDTLGTVLVKDSIFSNRDDLNIETLEKVPGTGKDFEIYTYNSIDDNFIEVIDPEPINPRRKIGGNMTPLKFGNQVEASTKGSWEK